MSAHSSDGKVLETPAARESLAELLDMARDLLADAELSDDEVIFLKEWLEECYWIASSFPGNVIHERVRRVLEDGVITKEERSHLVETLNELIDGRLEDLAENVELTELWFDEASQIDFTNTRFCLTGNFVFGPQEVCKTAIERLGGSVTPSVRHDTQFLVVGKLGVDEWRSGGLGKEIEAAMRMRARGEALKIISEQSWVSFLR